MRAGSQARAATRLALSSRRSSARRSFEPELVAEALPVAVGRDADEDLLAVGGGEELVDAPAHARALADLRHRHRRLAGGRVLGEPLADPEHDGLEEARGDLLPAARLRPLMERGQHRDHAVGRGADVHDRGAGAQRLAARAGHEGEPGRHLRELVEEGPRLRRAGEEALERQVDDAGMDARQHVVAQAQTLDRAVGEVVDDHVRARDEAQEEGPAIRRALQVDGDASACCGSGSGSWPTCPPACPATGRPRRAARP